MNKLFFLILCLGLLHLPVNAQNSPYFYRFKLDNGLKFAFSKTKAAETVIEINPNFKVNSEVHLPGLKATYLKNIANLLQNKKYALTVKANTLQLYIPNKNLEEALQAIAQILKKPKFEEKTLDAVRSEMINSLNNACQQTETIAFNIQQVVNFPNYPYGKIPTTSSLQSIKIEDLQNYHDENLSPNTLRITILGNHPPAQIKQLVNQYLGDWKEKQFYKKYIKKSKPPQERSIHLSKNEAAQTATILISHPIHLRPFGQYALATSLLNFIYQQQLNELFASKEISTHFKLAADKNLGLFSAGINLPAEQLEKTLPRFLQWIENITQTNLSSDDFISYKKQWLLQLNKERNAIEGQLSYAKHFLQSNKVKPIYDDSPAIKNLQPVDIQSVLNIFIHPQQSYLIIVLPPSYEKQVRSLFPNQKIHLHNCYGLEMKNITPNSDKTDVNSVLNKYINAIGGATKINAVQSISFSQISKSRKNTLEKYYQKKKPHLLKVQQSLNEKVSKEIIFDGNKAGLIQHNKTTKLIGAPAKDIQYRAYLFPEIAALKGVFHPRLIGIEDEFYIVEFFLTEKVKRRNYYQISTGLKVKSVLLRKNNTTIEEYDNYQPVQGILFPTEVIITNPRQQKIKYKVSNIRLNNDIPDANFEFKH